MGVVLFILSILGLFFWSIGVALILNYEPKKTYILKQAYAKIRHGGNNG